MEITSVGINSDLIFARFNGAIIDHGNFTAVKTPSNPEFYYGNFLIFERPPEATDIPIWQKHFEQVFDDQPRSTHKVFAWSPMARINDSARTALEDLGYEIDKASVLATQNTVARYAPIDGLEIRPLATDADWAEALKSQIDSRDLSFEINAYSAFKKRQMDNYHDMQNAGLGHWYGAFLGDKMAANMGIFHHKGVSRFQSVVTEPNFRRKGICSAMVHHISCETKIRYPENQLVIIADMGEPAERIYSALGFKKIETMESAMLRPAASFAKP